LEFHLGLRVSSEYDRLWPIPASCTATSWCAAERPSERQKPTLFGQSRRRRSASVSQQQQSFSSSYLIGTAGQEQPFAEFPVNGGCADKSDQQPSLLRCNIAAVCHHCGSPFGQAQCAALRNNAKRGGTGACTMVASCARIAVQWHKE